MAAVLELTDGTNTVDFVGSASEFTLMKDGLEIGFPDVIRLMGGDPLLSEGQRLSERKYGNREIEIAFKIEATNHNGLVKDIRILNRLLDTAKKTAVDIFGPKVELKYKFSSATNPGTVSFDVLDGEFEVGPRLASRSLDRDALLLECKLTLICQPYARDALPIRLNNHLVNASFDWNPSEGGRDSGSFIDLGASGDRLELTDATPFVPTGIPPILAGGHWIKRDTQQGAIATIIQVGQSVFSWALRMTATDKVEFRWQDTNNDFHVLTSDSTLPNGEWHFVWFTLFTTDGTDVVAVLGIDDKIEATLRLTSPLAIIAPTGANKHLTIGASQADTARSDGKFAGCVIFRNKSILPYQMIYLYRYGLKGITALSWFVREGVMTPAYWGMDKEDIAGLWPYTETNPIAGVTDESGNSRTLNIIGSPSDSPDQMARIPDGWTMGDGLRDSQDSGLNIMEVIPISSPPKWGHWAIRIEEAASAADKFISQVPDSALDTGDVTVLIWVLAEDAGDKFQFDAGGGTETITVSKADEWRVLIRTYSTGLATCKFGWMDGSGANGEVYIKACMAIKGHPYGTAGGFLDFTDSTQMPYVGHTALRAFPDNTKQNSIDIHDIGGDVPATCRLRIKNTSGKALGPIRAGMVSGQDAARHWLYWRASWWVPDFANGADYDSVFPNPKIETAADLTVRDRLRAGIGGLFPFPAANIGSYKAFIGVESEQNMVSLLRMKDTATTIPLSGDPAKDINAATAIVHMVDAGMLSWPPAVGLSFFRGTTITVEGLVSQSMREDQTFPSPELLISNIAEVAIADPGVAYHYIFLLPVDDGYIALIPPNGTNGASLLDGEIIVVDTIEEEALGPAYLIKQHNVSDTVGLQEVVMLNKSDLSIFGSGFMLSPDTSILISFLFSTGALAADLPFGKFEEDNTIELDIEISHRYLYV